MRAMTRSPRSGRWWLLEDRRLGGNRLARAVRELGHAPALVAHEPTELLNALADALPTLAIVDLSHERRDRQWLIGALAQRHPGLRILVIADGADARLARKLELLGADEVFTGGEGLAAAIRRAERRRQARPGRATARPAAAQLEGLTPREREVLAEIGQGSDNLTVAAVLGIRERTVKAHVTNLFRKLGAINRVELALAARALP